MPLFTILPIKVKYQIINNLMTRMIDCYFYIEIYINITKITMNYIADSETIKVY